MKKIKYDTKKLFLKKGTCSQTFFHIINRDFENNDPEREIAADPLSGGIMQFGHHCGLLLGATLAIGRESYRRHGDGVLAIQHQAGQAACRPVQVRRLHRAQSVCDQIGQNIRFWGWRTGAEQGRCCCE